MLRLRIARLAFAASAAVGLCLGGCSTSAVSSRSDIESITLERDPCFGACPVYTVTVYADGRVEFEGKRFVKQQGTATRHISTTEVAALFAKVAQIDFWSLEDDYTGRMVIHQGGQEIVRQPPTDLPTAYVTVKTPTRTKRVRDYWNAPEALHELEQRIDATAGVAEWIGGSAR